MDFEDEINKILDNIEHSSYGSFNDLETKESKL